MSSSSASVHYIVAATPRSGSTLLCDVLSGSGIGGRPREDFGALRSSSLPRQPREYFVGVEEPFVDRLAPTDSGRPETAAEFTAALVGSWKTATTPNGVYGTSLMWSSFDQLGKRLQTRPRLERASLPEALEVTFPNLHFVQILRRDKVAQAVSLWRALQTPGWRDLGDDDALDQPGVVYDFRAIDHLMMLQAKDEAAWTHWLARHDFPAFGVVYEELANAPRSGAAKVLEWLGVRGAEREIPSPGMRGRIATESDEWAQRYRYERDGTATTRSTRRLWKRQ